MDRPDIIENIIFGFMSPDDMHDCLNYIFLYAKYYIYINKQFGKNDLDIWRFNIYLINKIKCEIKIRKKEKTTMLDRVLSILLP